MVRVLYPLICLALLSACSHSRPKHREDLASKVPRAPAMRKLVSDETRYIAVGSGQVDPSSLCQGFRLSAKEMRHFFYHAQETPPLEREIAQGESVLSCHVRGVLREGKENYPFLDL